MIDHNNAKDDTFRFKKENIKVMTDPYGFCDLDVPILVKIHEDALHMNGEKVKMEKRRSGPHGFCLCNEKPFLGTGFHPNTCALFDFSATTVLRHGQERLPLSATTAGSSRPSAFLRALHC